MKPKYILIISAALLLAGCKKALEEKPYSFFESNTFYKTTDQVLASMNGVYQKLAQQETYGRNLTAIGTMGTDEAAVRVDNNEDWMQDFNSWNVNAETSTVLTAWRTFYSGINQCNALIERVGTGSFDTSFKKSIVAEAKFMRAFFYFNLVRWFGAVPLQTKETNTLAATNGLPRASVQEVYGLILSDLTEAANNLPATQTTTGRANRLTAQAYLSKVYLTMGTYKRNNVLTDYAWVDEAQAFQQAVNFGNQVIAANRYGLLTSYASVFDINNEGNREVIFDVQFIGTGLPDGFGSAIQRVYSILGPVACGGTAAWGLPRIELINRYDANDGRRSWTIANFRYQQTNNVCSQTTALGTIRGYCGKWREQPNAANHFASSFHNYPLLRYADVMLTVAEADAERNGAPTVLSYQLLNALRTARYTAAVTPVANLTMAAFRDFILNERSRELAFEGHRWFDLVRTGRLVSVVSNLQATPGVTNNSNLTKINIKPRHLLMPIPQVEIDLNQAIQPTDQNPGY